MPDDLLDFLRCIVVGSYDIVFGVVEDTVGTEASHAVGGATEVLDHFSRVEGTVFDQGLGELTKDRHVQMEFLVEYRISEFLRGEDMGVRGQRRLEITWCHTWIREKGLVLGLSRR